MHQETIPSKKNKYPTKYRWFLAPERNDDSTVHFLSSDCYYAPDPRVGGIKR